jgi:SAM-dependent methyltransferase
LTPGNSDAIEAVKSRLYPGRDMFGFGPADGTLPFLLRLHSLITPDATVLDFGAGRGVQAVTAHGIVKGLLDWRTRARHVIGADVSPAVYSNPLLHEAILLPESGLLPIPDDSVDVVVADWVFEHLENPSLCLSEIYRVLKPGGWLGFRTPNKRHYSMLASRLIPGSWHARILRRVQTARQEEDVFPKHYKMNTIRDCRKQLNHTGFDSSFLISHEPEPAYLAFSRAAFIAGAVYQRVVAALPIDSLRMTILGFAHKPLMRSAVKTQQPRDSTNSPGRPEELCGHD